MWVNAIGRVLASDTPAVIVGSAIRPGRGDHQELPPVDDWSACVGLPWLLISRPLTGRKPHASALTGHALVPEHAGRNPTDPDVEPKLA